MISPRASCAPRVARPAARALGPRVEQNAHGVALGVFVGQLERFGDAIQRTVTWKGAPDVSSLAGKPLRLRFVLNDADVYAFQFCP